MHFIFGNKCLWKHEALQWQKFDVEAVFMQELLANFTNNYKEMSSNIKLNMILSGKTEQVFSCKMYSNIFIILYIYNIL